MALKEFFSSLLLLFHPLPSDFSFFPPFLFLFSSSLPSAYLVLSVFLSSSSHVFLGLNIYCISTIDLYCLPGSSVSTHLLLVTFFFSPSFLHSTLLTSSFSFCFSTAASSFQFFFLSWSFCRSKPIWDKEGHYEKKNWKKKHRMIERPHRYEDRNMLLNRF